MQWLAVIFPVVYGLILAVIWKNLKKIKIREGVVNDPSLFISIIIPCKNEEQLLPLLLSDLARQNFQGTSFEVIVVDDHSTDSTFIKAKDFKGILNLTVLKNSGHGKKQAIRTGSQHSSGKLLITADADCRLNENWLSAISSFFIRYEPDMIICPVSLVEKKGFFGRFQELEFLSLQGITAGSANAGHPVMCNGANLAFKKEVYMRNSDRLFDEVASGDDIFLLHRLKKEGARIMWLESLEATAITMQAGDPVKFLKQRKRWLSKARYYDDADTIILATVTFITNLLLVIMSVAGWFNNNLFFVYLTVFIIKAFADYLILSETARRHNRKPLMKWFLPSAVIYPFYMLFVSLVSLLPSTRASYPSRTGILSS